LVDAAKDIRKQNKAEKVKKDTIFICKKSIKFMENFKYYRIEKSNPLI